MNNTIDNIVIRMYNTGSVGDCFLLLFQKKQKTTFSLLIDCGGYKTKSELIKSCVTDIKKVITNNTIDLVIVTHEHEDHVSGFNQARDIFDEITFKQVWMSWAEDETDDLAIKLLKEKRKRINFLSSVIKNKLSVLNKRIKNRIPQVGLNKGIHQRKENYENALAALEFEGSSFLSVKGRLKISDAMKYVKKKSKSKLKSKMFRRPGDVITDLPGAEGVKFYILGPPYHSDFRGIKNEEQHDEMYILQRKLGFYSGSFNFNAIASVVDPNVTIKSPFNRKFALEENVKNSVKTSYSNRENKWRQIEFDWLDSAGDLAIAISDYVNNTSLAFAIEISTSGKVLLFPADAQSGNWISWHDKNVSDSLKSKGGKDTAQLLQNTVFYKVGHHGSHNGTASKSGLDLMNSENNILAFMPLVQDKVPSQWGGSKKFPAKALYEKLLEKTKGMVVRTDIGLACDSKAKETQKHHFSSHEIDTVKKTYNNPLYKECNIKV